MVSIFREKNFKVCTMCVIDDYPEIASDDELERKQKEEVTHDKSFQKNRQHQGMYIVIHR